MKGNPCECGCGDFAKPGNRFINGHNRRGKPHTKETKEKIGKTLEGHTVTKETRKKIGEAKKGRSLPPVSKETKRKMSESHMGKKHSEETIRKMGESHKGKPGGFTGKIHSKKTIQEISRKNLGKKRSKECKKLRSENQRQLWQDPGYVAMQMRARNVCPNKAEVFLGGFFQDLLPDEYRFVGDGTDKDFIIAGKCPDFVNIKGQKKIIELFGEHVHEPEEERQRIDLFAQHGYQTLIIWYSELQNLDLIKQKILGFNKN